MRKGVLVSLIGLGLSVVCACRGDVVYGGFLHRAYQGTYTSGDYRYVISVDGTIAVQTMQEHNCSTYWPCNSTEPCQVCNGSAGKDWTTALTIQNRADLASVIAGLQAVEQAFKDAEKDK